MDISNLMNIFGLLNKNNSKPNNNNNIIQVTDPDLEKRIKEVEKSYPYGEFPFRFTKIGQELLKNKTNTINNPQTSQNPNTYQTQNKKNNGLNFDMLKNLLPMFNKNNSTDVSSLLNNLGNSNEISNISNILSNLKNANNTKSDDATQRSVENLNTQTKPFDSYEKY